ncbi:MAG TPA: NADP-dependent oxidoreductase [Acetobacteraceae bacterium]|jgi:NADPH:quinone reductase-like Zn-dependent oxidoreductase|nr:NADP-dependent oxidoreductase [Acetobacteraceae bacterium]
MMAIRIHRFGGPDVLAIEDIPDPRPQEGEIVIAVEAASVNPVDYKIRQGGFLPEDKLPMTLGRDVSGTIETLGPGVRGLRQGDAVYVMLSPDHGGYAERALAAGPDVAPRPARLDAAAAAAVPLAGLTAWQGLFDHGGLRQGQRVLIHGAAGGVGHLAVQFARARGAEVFATASARDLDFVHGLGAATVIDYKAQRFEDVAHNIDVVLDLVAGETQTRSWSVLKPGGIIVSSLQKPDQEAAAKHRARGTNFRAHPSGTQLVEIGRLIDAGEVRPEVSATLLLAQAAEAQRRLEHDHPRGKIVLLV